MNIIKNTTNSSIVVQWDDVDDSLTTTYIVTWTSERDLKSVQVKALIEQSSYTITGLTLDTVYAITVTANNKCGQGPQYTTIVSLTTDSTFSSTSTITASIAVMNPSITTTNPITTNGITHLKTSSTNPSAVITSTNTATDNMSPVSTMNPTDTTTTDENSKILSIG